MNTFKGKLMAGMLTSLVAFAAHAADTGPEALRKAKAALGTQTIQGETTDGQRCDLSFQDGGGVLLGDVSIGTYVLTVGGQDQGFDFIAESSSTENGDNTTFETVQHEDSNDSPDEGGFQRGFTTREKLEVSHSNGSMTVKIVNGTAQTCRFAE
jgi:type 1 fimbria pilin